MHTVPSNDDAFTSLIKTFRNGDFRIFVGSDVLYFLGLTIFQTGLPFFITSLMKLPETFTTILYVAMTLLSFACYMPVNALAHRMNKKKLVLIGFVGLSIVYVITAVSGLLGGSGLVFGIVIVCAAAFPMAILGICRRLLWRISRKRTRSSRAKTGRACSSRPERSHLNSAKVLRCSSLRHSPVLALRPVWDTGSRQSPPQ